MKAHGSISQRLCSFCHKNIHKANIHGAQQKLPWYKAFFPKFKHGVAIINKAHAREQRAYKNRQQATAARRPSSALPRLLFAPPELQSSIKQAGTASTEASKLTSPAGRNDISESASAHKAGKHSANGRMPSLAQAFSVKKVIFIIIAARQTTVLSCI